MLDARALESGRIPRELAVRFVPVIRQIALRVARRLPSHVSVDDLIGAGYLGFVDAFRRYEPARCDRFDVYAEVRIKGAMLDELRSYDPLSRDLRAFANRIAASTRALETRLGRAPNEDELAAEVGLPVPQFRIYASKAAVGPTLSLDASGDDEPRMELTDETNVLADDALAREQNRRGLIDAIAQLPERLRSVVDFYYREELTLRQIGERLGVTESRVCQLHGEAVARLRAAHGGAPKATQRRAPSRRAAAAAATDSVPTSERRASLPTRRPRPQPQPVVEQASMAA